MPRAILVVPFALETTMRFALGAARIPDLELGIVSREPEATLRRHLGGHEIRYARVQDALDPDELTASIREIAGCWGGRVDRVLAVLEQLQVPLAEVRERLGIPGMSVRTATNFRDKAVMKDVLREHGLPCARHELCSSADAALAFARRHGYPVVVKPQAGAGAKNTMRVERHEDLARYLASWPLAHGQRVLLEEFVTGAEHSFDSVTLNGEHLLHSITQYYPTPLEVMETPWIQWCVVMPRDIDGPEFAEIRSAGPAALDCLGLRTGLTHMEWFRKPDGTIAISEVAARPPGAQFTTMLSYAHDFDFYRAWPELLACERFEVPERKYAVGAAFLRGQGSGEVHAVHGLDAVRADLGDLVIEAKVPRPGQPQASSYEGEGWVILRHPESDRVVEGLKHVVSSVRVELG